MERLGWMINEDDDYFAACDRCEINVRILQNQDLERIENFLRYDKRDHGGSKGRALTRDLVINGTQLQANDRLEPSRSLPNVGELHLVDEFPTIILFWRVSDETLTRHRNPLFDRTIGITPRRSLTVDVLHAFFLGVLNIWAKIALWKLIEAGAYGNLGTQAENLRAAALVLRSALMSWYKRYAADHKGENLTRVADLTVKMLGTSADPKLKRRQQKPGESHCL
jgi:hypothetical protein